MLGKSHHGCFIITGICSSSIFGQWTSRQHRAGRCPAARRGLRGLRCVGHGDLRSLQGRCDRRVSPDSAVAGALTGGFNPFVDGFSTINNPFWGYPYLWKPSWSQGLHNLAGCCRVSWLTGGCPVEWEDLRAGTIWRIWAGLWVFFPPGTPVSTQYRVLSTAQEELLLEPKYKVLPQSSSLRVTKLVDNLCNWGFYRYTWYIMIYIYSTGWI